MSDTHITLITAFLIAERRIVKYVALINQDRCGFHFHDAVEYHGEYADKWKDVIGRGGADVEIISVEIVEGDVVSAA